MFIFKYIYCTHNCIASLFSSRTHMYRTTNLRSSFTYHCSVHIIIHICILLKQVTLIIDISHGIKCLYITYYMDLIQVRECCFISMKKITLTQKSYWLIMHCIKLKGKHVTLLIYLNGTSNTTSTEDPGWNIRLSAPLIVV